MTPTWYIAGPMSGIPQFNFPAFDAAAAALRAQGYRVISPAELDDQAVREAALASEDGQPGQAVMLAGQTWADFLSRDVQVVADQVTGVVLLPGWAKSRGARLEAFVALLCGHALYEWPALDAVPEWSVAIRVTQQWTEQGAGS